MTTLFDLPGLSGSNPLAYLATLGTLRALSYTWRDRTVNMAWRQEGAWIPVLHVGGDTLTRSELITALLGYLSNQQDRPHFTLKPPAAEAVSSLKKIPQTQYRQFAHQASLTPDYTELAEFAAAWAGEFNPRHNDDDVAYATDFDFTAGKQQLLGMMRQTIVVTEERHLEECLFGPWQYRDTGLSLRWDLLDETRRYALQAVDPTNSRDNPIMTVRGANRLAIEALPLFPIIPTARGSQTTGFTRIDGTLVWTWPIWSRAIDVNVVRSLLAHPLLHQLRPDRKHLNQISITEVYRSRVVSAAGYYLTFAPPQPA